MTQHRREAHFFLSTSTLLFFPISVSRNPLSLSLPPSALLSQKHTQKNNKIDSDKKAGWGGKKTTKSKKQIARSLVFSLTSLPHLLLPPPSISSKSLFFHANKRTVICYLSSSLRARSKGGDSRRMRESTVVVFIFVSLHEKLACFFLSFSFFYFFFVDDTFVCVLRNSARRKPLTFLFWILLSSAYSFIMFFGVRANREKRGRERV